MNSFTKQNCKSSKIAFAKFHNICENSHTNQIPNSTINEFTFTKQQLQQIIKKKIFKSISQQTPPTKPHQQQIHLTNPKLGKKDIFRTRKSNT